MRRSKEERAALELARQVENDLPEATCEGNFYIGYGKDFEICPYRNCCDKHKNYINAMSDYTLYDRPMVRFYYVNGFRNCKFRKLCLVPQK